MWQTEVANILPLGGFERGDCLSLFFFNDTATTEIYTLSLHDALPISHLLQRQRGVERGLAAHGGQQRVGTLLRSEEHTSELQSRQYLVCRLLLVPKQQIY